MGPEIIQAVVMGVVALCGGVGAFAYLKGRFNALESRVDKVEEREAAMDWKDDMFREAVLQRLTAIETELKALKEIK